MSRKKSGKPEKPTADPSKVVFIRWEEEEKEFTHFAYMGAGWGEEARFKTVTVTKEVVWLRTATQEAVDGALKWVAERRPEARVVVEAVDEETFNRWFG